MARKQTKIGRVAATPLPDEELIGRLEEKAPEVLTARLSEAVFDAAVEGLLKEPSLSDDVPHFYCRRCGEYHLKTHPHYTAMQSRSSKRHDTG
jgi:hypothetical protein